MLNAETVFSIKCDVCNNVFAGPCTDQNFVLNYAADHGSYRYDPRWKSYIHECLNCAGTRKVKEEMVASERFRAAADAGKAKE